MTKQISEIEIKEVRLEKDLALFYVEANNFPHDVKETFEKLERMLPTRRGRKFFGIMEGKPDDFTYKAAVLEQYQGEGNHYSCKSYRIPKGTYVTHTISNWRNSLSRIGEVFTAFASRNDVDTSVQIEYYKSQVLLVCMVKQLDS
jgi:hypothetical protein